MYSYNKYKGISASIVSTVSKAARRLIKQGYFEEDEIEDLEQELLLEVLLKRHEYQEELASISHFIRIVIDNKSKDLIRRRFNQNRKLDFSEPDELMLSDQEFWGNSSVHSFEHVEFQLDIDIVIDRLPPDLHVLSEQLKTTSIREIIKETGISKRQIYKKIKILRDIMGNNFS